MIKAILLFSALLIISCAQGRHTSSESKQKITSSHETHFPHPHKHGTNCGHDTKTIGFDTVYVHDGHNHKVHGDHVDDINE